MQVVDRLLARIKDQVRLVDRVDRRDDIRRRGQDDEAPLARIPTERGQDALKLLVRAADHRLLGQVAADDERASLADELGEIAHRIERHDRRRRDDEDAVVLILDQQLAVLHHGGAEGVVVQVVEVELVGEEAGRDFFERSIDLDGLGLLRRGELRPDAGERVVDRDVCDVPAARVHVAHPPDVVRVALEVSPPRVLPELRRRALLLTVALDRVVEGVRDEEVDPPRVLEVGDLLHLRQGEPPPVDAERLAHAPLAAEDVRRRTAELRRVDVRVGSKLADLVDAGDVLVLAAAEEVAEHAGVLLQLLFDRHVADRLDAVLLAPVVERLEVDVAKEQRVDVVVVGADLPVVADVVPEREELRAQIVALDALELGEELGRPGVRRRVAVPEVVVESRLVGEDAGDRPAEVVLEAAPVLLVRGADELGDALRVEQVDVPVLGVRRLPVSLALHEEVDLPVLVLSDPVEAAVPDPVGDIDNLASVLSQHRHELALGEFMSLGCRDGDLRQVLRTAFGARLEDSAARISARPVVLVVEPHPHAVLPGLADGEADAVEPRLGEVRHLEAPAGVDEGFEHALVAHLAELAVEFLLIEVAVPEPERDRPVRARRVEEYLRVKSVGHVCLHLSLGCRGGFRSAIGWCMADRNPLLQGGCGLSSLPFRVYLPDGGLRLVDPALDGCIGHVPILRRLGDINVFVAVLRSNTRALDPLLGRGIEAVEVHEVLAVLVPDHHDAKMAALVLVQLLEVDAAALVRLALRPGIGHEVLPTLLGAEGRRRSGGRSWRRRRGPPLRLASREDSECEQAE